MKTNILCAPVRRPDTSVSLHALIKKITLSLLPLAVTRRNVINIEVSPEIRVSTDENMLSYVISTLLSAALSATESESIQLGAALSGDYTFIKMKDNENRFFRVVQPSLPSLQQAAEKMGGCISIQHNKATGTLTTFSFYNGLKAA